MSLHPHDTDQNGGFAELDAHMRRLDNEALTALSARLDVAVRLREVQRAAADLPAESDVPAARGQGGATSRQAFAWQPERPGDTVFDTHTDPVRDRGDDPGTPAGREIGG